jgi:Signal peptidase I
MESSKGSAVATWLWDWAKSIGVALIVWLFLRTFLIEAFHIPSGSMEKTLLVGDWLFVNKALYGAEVPFIHKHLPAVASRASATSSSSTRATPPKSASSRASRW